jgi:hypothetical protein
MAPNPSPKISREKLWIVDTTHRSMSNKFMSKIQQVCNKDVEVGVAFIDYTTYKDFIDGYEDQVGWEKYPIWDLMLKNETCGSISVGLGPDVTANVLEPESDIDIVRIAQFLLVESWQLKSAQKDFLQFADTIQPSSRRSESEQVVIVVNHWIGRNERNNFVPICYDEDLLMQLVK